MKKSGLCPKCGSSRVLHIDTRGLWNRNAYQQIIVKQKTIQTEKYICQDCGYIESYVIDDDLKKCKESE